MAVGQITEQGAYIVIALDGEIDLETAPAVRKALLDHLKKGRNLLIDLAGVSYIDSSGIASLVEGLQLARKQGNDLALVSVSQRVHRVLELARLDKVFTLHADLAGALSGGRASGPAPT